MSTGIFEETIAASARAAVMRGVAVLDHYFQGESWMHKINLETLNTFSARVCILGQLFHGSYSDGREEVFGDSDKFSDFWMYVSMVADCGFSIIEANTHWYADLDVAWREVISEYQGS